MTCQALIWKHIGIKDWPSDESRSKRILRMRDWWGRSHLDKDCQVIQGKLARCCPELDRKKITLVINVTRKNVLGKKW